MQEWEAFQETWSAFEVSNPDNLNTDWIRKGWAKPTIYKEHEVIHILASVIDQTRVYLANEEEHHRKCDEALERRVGVAEDKLERVEALLRDGEAGILDTSELIYVIREVMK